MRIIAGDYRGRTLVPPRDASTTRPMTDRVKETLFNRLASHGFFDENADGSPLHAADLFAGTGSLGLEALSRGYDFCTFIEPDRDAADRLEQNLDALDARRYARLLRADALNPTWTLRLDATPLSLVLLDPPYPLVEDAAGLDRVVALLVELRPRLAEVACVVLRTPQAVTPPAIPHFRGPGSHAYGSTRLNFYVTDTTPTV